MVCGAFSSDHMLQLEVVNGTLNSQNYRDEILETDARRSLNSLECQNLVLQDDNAIPERARDLKEYRNIASLPLPSLSPDLNPIEHVWDELGRRLRNRKPAVSTLCELHKALLEECGRLPRLVTSIIKRYQVVIRQEGGYTQFKSEVADYCEPFREIFHQILKVYAPKTIFRKKMTTIIIVDILLESANMFFCLNFVKLMGKFC